MKKTCIYLAMVLALTLVLAGASQAAMWVGIQGGPNFTANSTVKIPQDGESFDPIKWDPAVLGGVIIGYDFVKEGFLGYDWPSWMKYFSFVTDFTYNRATNSRGWVTETEAGVGSFPEKFGPLEASLACWSFLFKFRYGFLPDTEVPFGRLQPYIMVGPGIMFSSLRGGDIENNTVSDSSVDIALVTEAGVRYMALKNVSLDAGFRYRFASPSYTHMHSDERMSIKTDFNLFTAMFRVSYHF